MRARYRAPSRPRCSTCSRKRAPALVPVGISAGIGVLLELPEDGPDSSHLVEAALRRSIELYPLASSYHEGRGPQDGIVLGYGALPEHDFEAGLSVLGEVLSELFPA